jgi:hypothetical protein
MFTLRKTAVAGFVLATGISAVWLSPKLNSTGHNPPSPVAIAPSTTTANDTASPQDCCGGQPPALTEADHQRQPDEKRTQAALLAKFDDWAERYARADAEKRTTMIPEGKAIAQERRGVMTKLIKEDPRHAIEAADSLSPLARRELPPEVAEEVETMVSAKGDLEVLGVTTREGNSYRRFATIDGERFAAFTYGKRSNPIPETNAPLIGIFLPATETINVGQELVQKTEKLFALREDKFRVLSKGETTLIRQTEETPQVHHCPVSGDETTDHAEETAVDTGGEIVWLCKNGHVAPFVEDSTGHMVAAADVNGGIQKAYAGGPGEGAGSFPAIPAGWTTGSKRLIVMPTRFPEQAANPFGSADINGAASTARDRFNAWSYGRASFTYTLTPILTLPRSESSYAGNGGEDAMMADAINIANNQGYNASGANFRTLIFSGAYGGYCGLGQIVGQHNWVKCIDPHVITHEVGHNLGLPHANSWTPSTWSPYGAGTHNEYGGAYNTMGQGPGSYDTMMRFYLRWLTFTETVDVTGPGTYRIYDPEVWGLTGGRKYAIRIPKPGGQYYFAEFRPRATSLAGYGDVDSRTQNGMRLLRTDGSQQMDLTPGSANGFRDAAIITGESTTDATSGWTFTVNAKGGSGESQYIDVAVSYLGGNYYIGSYGNVGTALHGTSEQYYNGSSYVAGCNEVAATPHPAYQAFQRWTITHIGSGQYHIVNNVLNLSLQATNDPYFNGSSNVGGANKLALSPNYWNSSQQVWLLTPAAQGYSIANPTNSQNIQASQDSYRGISGCYQVLGSPYSWGVGNNQQWNLVPN